MDLEPSTTKMEACTKVNGSTDTCKVMVNYTTNLVSWLTKVPGRTISSVAKAYCSTRIPSHFPDPSTVAISTISSNIGPNTKVIMYLLR